MRTDGSESRESLFAEKALGIRILQSELLAGSLTRIIHEASTARVDQADLTGVLGLRPLRRGVKPRLGSEALGAIVGRLLPGCWTIPLPGWHSMPLARISHQVS